MAKMIIGGEAVDSVSGERYEVRSPATGEIVDTSPNGTVEDARRAIAAADLAFKTWSKTPPAKRAEILARAEHVISEHEEDLACTLTLEQGKTLREAKMEIHRFCHTIKHYAGLGKSLRGGYVPMLDEKRYGMIIKKPLGVCGAIVPWNFPISLMGNKIAPALLTGNTVVVKPAGTTPLTTIKVIELFHKAGLPAGALNVVIGSGRSVGEEILRHPKVRKIGFTGATSTGKHVMAVAAAELKHVTLELGGSDPMIVCDDANLEAAVSAASVGRFFNCGQACLAVKRLFLFEKIYDEFLSRLCEKVKKLRVGNGLDPKSTLGPLHSSGQRQEVEEQVQDAVARGARVIAGGKRPEGKEYEKGYFYLPTLVVDVPDEARMLTEECFGPALPIVKVKDLSEALAKANSSIYGLGSSVWTRDINKATIAAEQLEAGYTWVNSAQIIYDELPFGGVKQSGLGKEHGSEVLDYYMETKSVVIAIE
ncbi:MAG: aldehyde dehydrogenase [Acidobacteria bacterium]|nr:aldehyde dehydrogenase [Acidobacteriota bacterium]MBI3658589.1 aldehyde dehydrogenase [Acidobacteriota bacterium]